MVGQKNQPKTNQKTNHNQPTLGWLPTPAFDDERKFPATAGSLLRKPNLSLIILRFLKKIGKKCFILFLAFVLGGAQWAL